MPYKSVAQAAYMHIHHPEIAAKWDKEHHKAKKKGQVKKLPGHVSKGKDEWVKPMIAGTAAGALANQFPRVQDVVREKKRKKARIKKLLVTSTDPDFNTEAAQQAFDLVMKMDYDSAQMFTAMVVGEVLDETISKNLSTLQRHLDEVVAKRTELVKRAVSRAVAKRDDDEDAEALAFAQALTVISKATPYDYGYRFRESDFRRDPATGQFRVKVKPPTMKKPLSSTQAESFNIAKPKQKLDAEQKKRYQSDYMQVAQFLAAVQQSGGMANNDVLVHIKDKDGDVYTTYASTANPSGLWNPKNEKVIGVSARPNSLNIQGASFGLARSLGADVPAARRAGAGMGAIDAGMPKFSEDWTGAGHGDEAIRSSNARLYGRTKAASDYLARYGNATGNTQVQMAAAFGSFVGSHGPEAERVIGPSMRKTAYRYRGTEKTPERHIVSLYDRAIGQAKATGYQRGEEGPPGVTGPRRRGGGPPEEGPPPSRMAAVRDQAAAREPTWEERELGRKVITEQLRFKLPDPHLYGLQLASGHTPPSEGILLNSKGQIVTQAVGYGDDHYLPFNLKNLKALKGGEYIRTRSVGGPTSEDIYTGLMSGARRVTVVSRSGTFTVEFDPTFRGGRRYNDKAQRMTDRYEHILDAVQSEQVDAKPVDRAIQQRIREEVDRDFPGWKPSEKQRVFTEKIEEYKSIKGLAPEDQAYIDARIATEVQRDPLTDQKQLRSDLTAQALAEKQFKYRLDGEGYGSALRALEEQFPYYIKTRYEARRAEHVTEQERDKGYVMPRHNRPSEALHGYFETRIAGEGAHKTKSGKATGKIRASEADYQNYRNRREAPPVSTEGETPQVTGGSSTGTTVTAGSSRTNQVKENIQERADERNYVSTAWDLAAAVRIKQDAGGAQWLKENPLVGLVKADNRSEFERQLETPEGRTKFEQTVMTAEFKAQADAADPNLWVNFRNVANRVDLKNYTQADSHRFLPKPWRFPGDAYRKTADPALVRREMETLDSHSFPVSGAKKYTEMSDSEKETELKRLVFLKGEVGSLKGADPTTMQESLGLAGIGNVQNAINLVGKGENGIQAQIDNLHKIRALQANQARREAGEQTRAGAAVDRALAGATPEAQGNIALRAQVFPGTNVKLSDMQHQRALLDTAVDVLGNFPDRQQAARSLAEEGQRLERRLTNGDQIAAHEVTDWMEKAKKLNPGLPDIGV